MNVQFRHKNSEYTADLNQPLEIGIKVAREKGVSSFGIANANYQIYKDGDFIGNKQYGSGCNLETITFTPHGNSTHTECLGHISTEPFFVNDYILDTFYKTQLHTFKSKKHNGDFVLDFKSLNLDELIEYECLVIRTLPNKMSKLNTDYSGLNAPYILAEDMAQIVAAGIKHLILDLPSVDKEWDGGALAAHHIFWSYPDNPRKDASITEFAFIPKDIKDGEYLLKLNISSFVSDAAPSRPTLYPVKAS